MKDRYVSLSEIIILMRVVPNDILKSTLIYCFPNKVNFSNVSRETFHLIKNLYKEIHKIW